MRTTLLLVLLLLTGCTSKDDAYKKKILPLYDSLVKIRNDIQSGKVSPSFSPDCDAAKDLLDKAHADLPQEDQSRPSFTNMEGALETYIALRSIASQAAPDKITQMASGASSDLEKAKSSLDKGD